jgi:hypothetical protein
MTGFWNECIISPASDDLLLSPFIDYLRASLACSERLTEQMSVGYNRRREKESPGIKSVF